MSTLGDAAVLKLDATTTDSSAEDIGEKEGEEQDVLIELFWHIKHKRGISFEDDLPFQEIVLSLESEGILFWRDKRYAESQKVALGWTSTQQPHIHTLPEVISEDQEEEEDQEKEGEKEEKEGGQPNEIVLQKIHALPVSYDEFVNFVRPCARLFLNAYNEGNVIPDWTSFTTDITRFYEESKAMPVSGITAQYIPILRDANPDKWGVSICSISGQRFSMGDSSQPFCLESSSKPVTYAMAIATEGEDFVEQWIDVEPAGRPFNTQDLDPGTHRPFNACVNSGAMMAAGIVASGYMDTDADDVISDTTEKITSPIPSKAQWRDIVDDIREKWRELSGHDGVVGFSEETFDSEKETAYINYAIAYNVKGRLGLPRDVSLHKMLEVYLGCCSIEMTTEALSVAAATLANGGICPITEKEVFPADVVRQVLSETMTCGMYNGAGRFMVEVGFPAKSGVAGSLMVMVPGLFGMATFSPRLTEAGNSVQGIDFCKRLGRCYRLHMFEPFGGNHGGKIDPRQNGWKNVEEEVLNLAWATSVGDNDATKHSLIFLAALCRVSVCDKEELSPSQEKMIQDKYKERFGVALDQQLFTKLLTHVRKNPNDYKKMEKLSHEIVVTDAMKEIIFNGMVEIASTDHVIGPKERQVISYISERTLGMNKEVVDLELNRHLKRIGNRFDSNSNFDCTSTQSNYFDNNNNADTFCPPRRSGGGHHRSSLLSSHFSPLKK